MKTDSLVAVYSLLCVVNALWFRLSDNRSRWWYTDEKSNLKKTFAPRDKTIYPRDVALGANSSRLLQLVRIRSGCVQHSGAFWLSGAFTDGSPVSGSSSVQTVS